MKGTPPIFHIISADNVMTITGCVMLFQHYMFFVYYLLFLVNKLNVNFDVVVLLCDSQVLKFLLERNSINALHGQVTIGTLILQV